LCSWTSFGEALTVFGEQESNLSANEFREARYLLLEVRVIPSTSRRLTTY